MKRRGIAFAVILVLAGCSNASNHSSPRDSNARRTRIVRVRLVSAPPPVKRACRTASRRLDAGIYCPTLVPPKWGTQMEVCAGCNGTFSATGSFPAPRGYVGIPGEYRTGHFTIWAEPHRLIRQWLVGCNGNPFGHTVIAGLRMTWTTCPSGSELDSGHVLLEWSTGRWLYALSLHSNTPTNRRLLRIMAAHLALIRGT